MRPTIHYFFLSESREPPSPEMPYLPIQLDLGVIGLVDEHGVRHAVLTHPGIDALDPQPAEVPFLVL